MGQNQTSQANSRPRSPVRFGSIPTSPPCNPMEYHTGRITSTVPYIDSTYSTSDMSVLSRGSYPGSPSPSTTSTNSISSASPRPNFEMHDLYSPTLDKYICPMKGCLYSVLGFSLCEELEQHMTMLNHFPEPSAVVNPQMVTILDTESTFEHTEDWLALQQDILDENIYSTPPPTYTTPPPTYEFTFTYDQKKQFPPTLPAPMSPISNQCDCQHCQLQNSRTYPTPMYPTKRKSSTKRKSVYDIPTPLTVQMPPPPIIINLPPPPPPPTSNPSKIAKTSSTSPNLNQYAIWQQQIQIAQVTEMLQAQQRQREAQRRKREADPSATGRATPQLGYAIPGEQDYSQVYGFPRSY